MAQAPLQFRKSNRFDPVLPDPPVDHSGGISCYEQEMLNGFTAGHSLVWTKKMGKAVSNIELTFFANYGIGIRIPWEAKVTVEPKLITEVRPDQSPFTSNLSIQTHNADPASYSRVGLAGADIFDGKELLLEAGAGLAAKVVIFGATALNRPPGNPLVGAVVDLSAHFAPPMNGNSVSFTGPVFPYETTNLAYNAWNALTGGGIRKPSRTLFIAQENSPGSLPFAVDDDSPKSMTFGGDHYYRHGAVYSDAAYNSDITITPQLRIRMN